MRVIFWGRYEAPGGPKQAPKASKNESCIISQGMVLTILVLVLAIVLILALAKLATVRFIAIVEVKGIISTTSCRAHVRTEMTTAKMRVRLLAPMREAVIACVVEVVAQIAVEVAIARSRQQDAQEAPRGGLKGGRS